MAAQLGEVLARDKARLERLLEQQSEAKKNTLSQVAAYYSVLQSNVSLCSTSISQYSLNMQRQADTVTFAWLKATANATRQKLRLMLKQILADTYTGETVPALEKIKYVSERICLAHTHTLSLSLMHRPTHCHCSLGHCSMQSSRSKRASTFRRRTL